MRLALGAVMAALTVLVGLGQPARAQADDGDAAVRRVHVLIANALNEALEYSRSDRPLAWSDPSGSVTGVITIYAAAYQQGGRACRGFKYVVRDATQEVTETGLRCRDQGGLWSIASVPDIVAARPVPPFAASATPLGLPMPEAPPPDPILARLQRNLIRLGYGGDPPDGLRQPGFEAALEQFQMDEGLPQTSDANAIRRALAASAASVARAEKGGACETPANSQANTLVCGRRR